jgi:hypothetical protein
VRFPALLPLGFYFGTRVLCYKISPNFENAAIEAVPKCQIAETKSPLEQPPVKTALSQFKGREKKPVTSQVY